MTNKLYYGDNLVVLRNDIKDESVDLIYLDPPFNSNATYNVLFKSPATGPSVPTQASRPTSRCRSGWVWPATGPATRRQRRRTWRNRPR